VRSAPAAGRPRRRQPLRRAARRGYRRAARGILDSRARRDETIVQPLATVPPRPRSTPERHPTKRVRRWPSSPQAPPPEDEGPPAGPRAVCRLPSRRRYRLSLRRRRTRRARRGAAAQRARARSRPRRAQRPAKPAAALTDGLGPGPPALLRKQRRAVLSAGDTSRSPAARDQSDSADHGSCRFHATQPLAPPARSR